jgi:hypothetical protein
LIKVKDTAKSLMRQEQYPPSPNKKYLAQVVSGMKGAKLCPKGSTSKEPGRYCMAFSKLAPKTFSVKLKRRGI